MTATGTAQSPSAQIEANVALMRRLYEDVVNHQNRAALTEILAPDFVDHIPQPLPGQPSSGLKALEWFIDTARTAIPDLHVTVDDIIAAGDKVVARVTWQGTQKGRLLGAEPTGKPLQFMGIDIARIADGKIVEHWGQIDVLRVIAQLGFMPS
jgi:predicted ester cyclase